MNALDPAARRTPAENWKAWTEQPTHFSSSLSGIRCPRELYYRARSGEQDGPTPGRPVIGLPEARDLAFDHGSTDGQKVRVTLETNGSSVRGWVDDVYEFGGVFTLLKRHVIDPAEWDVARARPLTRHLNEMTLLAFAAQRLVGRADWELHYENAETGEVVAFGEEPCLEKAAQLLARFDAVAEARMDGIAPRCPINGDAVLRKCNCPWSEPEA